MPESRYCAVGLYAVGSGRVSLVSTNGRIWLFDTVAIAREVLPILGGEGRIAIWSPGREAISWSPILRTGFNRAEIVTRYDPYDLPANMPNGARSEAHGMPWKYHVMWSHVMTDCGQFELRSDGSLANLAVGEEVY